MSGLQLAILGGALAGLGVAALVSLWVPAQPDLGDALARLEQRPAAGRSGVPAGVDRRERLGLWAVRVLPPRWVTWGPVPTRDLAVIRMPLSRFYGEKARLALIALLAPAAWAAFATALGLRPPLVIPVVVTLALTIAAWFVPDWRVREAARTERAAFVVSLGAWADLVAMERLGGRATRQAMENAAAVGDGPAFQRVREVLAFSLHDRQPAWEALAGLAEELDVPQLAEMAEAMRLGGEEGAQIVTILRARAASIRDATLIGQVRAADKVAARLVLPTFALAVVYVLMIATPAVLRLLQAS